MKKQNIALIADVMLQSIGNCFETLNLGKVTRFPNAYQAMQILDPQSPKYSTIITSSYLNWEGKRETIPKEALNENGRYNPQLWLEFFIQKLREDEKHKQSLVMHLNTCDNFTESFIQKNQPIIIINKPTRPTKLAEIINRYNPK